MNKNQALDFIRSNLNKEPLTYQLGFLQGFLAKQLSEKPEIISEFKAQIRAAQQPK
jgi:hypothetical protein